MCLVVKIVYFYGGIYINDSSVQNKKDDGIDNFTLLAKYIRYQMLQANDGGIVNKINDIGLGGLGFDEDDKALDSKKIIVENDEFNSISNIINMEIDKIEKLSSDILNKDLQGFKNIEFLNGMSFESLCAQTFN